MTAEPSELQLAKQRVGTTLRDKWHLDALIGVGGMASVYAATHRNRKRGAVKMLHPEYSADKDCRTRFIREGYVANTVGHPGAVTVDDDDIAEDGSAFLVMELLEGESLHSRAERKGGRLPLHEVLAFVDQLLDVLAAAHDRGIIHRDIKPDNLFNTRSGQLKVLDFGIARLRDGTDASVSTASGRMLGTPEFMAPEHAKGLKDEIEARTDLWSVGATMFTLLTGRTVHNETKLTKQLVAACTRKAPPIASILPEIHPAAASVIDRALAFDRTDRWPNARGMQTAVRVCIGQDRRVNLSDLSWPATSPVPMNEAEIGAAGSMEPTVGRKSAVARRRMWIFTLLAGTIAAMLISATVAIVAIRARQSAPRQPEASTSASATGSGAMQRLGK
jgi:eukaryotic-like serine/threonine-protein kinase